MTIVSKVRIFADGVTLKEEWGKTAMGTEKQDRSQVGLWYIWPMAQTRSSDGDRYYDYLTVYILQLSHPRTQVVITMSFCF